MNPVDYECIYEAVNIIRCRNCAWYDGYGFCNGPSFGNYGHMTSPDWFCADGERVGSEEYYDPKRGDGLDWNY